MTPPRTGPLGSSAPRRARWRPPRRRSTANPMPMRWRASDAFTSTCSAGRIGGSWAMRAADERLREEEKAPIGFPDYDDNERPVAAAARHRRTGRGGPARQQARAGGLPRLGGRALRRPMLDLLR